jgi:hypothetical protein
MEIPRGNTRKTAESRTLKWGSNPPPSRGGNLAGHKRPHLQSIPYRWRLALRIGTVKKSTNFIRVDGPVRPMRIGAAKEPTETMASWEFDIAAEGVHKGGVPYFWPKANQSNSRKEAAVANHGLKFQGLEQMSCKPTDLPKVRGGDSKWTSRFSGMVGLTLLVWPTALP